VPEPTLAKPPSPAPPDDTLLELLRRSALLRLLAVGALVLLLQIPISMIRGVIGEREARRNEALAEVSASWGGPERIFGPRLVVPYEVASEHTDSAGATRTRRELRHAHFLPEVLEASGDADTDLLHRGIFDVPVYRLRLALRGSFARPDFSDWIPSEADVLWERAALVIHLSDARAIQHAVTLRWNDAELPFLPGAGEGEAAPAIHALLGTRARDAQEGRFAVDLELHGSHGLFLAPFGKETRVELAGDWPDPSFRGAWLPAERGVFAEGFRAVWRIPYLGRSYPQRTDAPDGLAEAIEASAFGLELATPVDPYRMAERSAKYASLFLLATFGTLWLFEVLASVRVHSVQYLLVGAAIVLFFLLELSLAEHLGFGRAYALASSGVVALVSGYASAVLQRLGRASLVAGLLVALYGFLFVILTNQDYALLTGALGLFAGLAVVMFLTRHVDWGAFGRQLGDGVN